MNAFRQAEEVRKAALPSECHLAPDDSPAWSAWERIPGALGEIHSRYLLAPTPLDRELDARFAHLVEVEP